MTRFQSALTRASFDAFRRRLHTANKTSVGSLVLLLLGVVVLVRAKKQSTLFPWQSVFSRAKPATMRSHPRRTPSSNRPM